MELVTVREIYKEREKYLNQEIRVGGWIRSIRDSKTLVLSFCMTELSLRHFRLYIMIKWKTFRKSPS